jgi:branched-chain amino acid aminotransferase
MIWWNGKFLPESEARISIYDSALMFGDMAFEMMRTFNKQTFRLWEHLERLYKSLNILEIDIPYCFDELFDAHENLILHNRYCWKEDDEVRTLINVSRGTLPIYQNMLKDDGKPNVIIATFPLREIVKGMSKYYKTGVRAIVPSQRAIPESLLDPKIKSRSRQHYQIANLEVKRQDEEAWTLLLDPDGFVTESTGANFFLLKENTFELITPKPKHILRGISRDYVMKLARKLGIEVIEKDITLYDVYEAREAFFTCTPFSIMPCTKINGKPIGEGKVGKKTKYLQHKWFEEEKCNWIEQMEKWDAVA